jgi:hypothetical protein
MDTETQLDIPDAIRDAMRDDEIENMQSLDGWAIGTVCLIEEDNVRTVTTRIEDAWIELFNGAGRAGESDEQSTGSTIDDHRSSKFGGVRFMAVDSDGEYRESYAYPNRDALSGNEPGWYVAEYVKPTEPRIGPEEPRYV